MVGLYRAKFAEQNITPVTACVHENGAGQLYVDDQKQVQLLSLLPVCLAILESYGFHVQTTQVTSQQHCLNLSSLDCA